jgi:hypothetical protein
MTRICVPAALLWLTATSAFAASPPATVAATVSATVPATAGTATFTIQLLDASLTANLDGALSVLQDTGASASTLTGIAVSISQGLIVTQYNFSVRVPASGFAATRDRLLAIQRSLQNSTSRAVGWSTVYTPGDEDLVNAVREAMPGLMERARAKAEVLAAQLDKKLGAVQSISAPEVISSGLSLLVTATVTYEVASPEEPSKTNE